MKMGHSQLYREVRLDVLSAVLPLRFRARPSAYQVGKEWQGEANHTQQSANHSVERLRSSELCWRFPSRKLQTISSFPPVRVIRLTRAYG